MGKQTKHLIKPNSSLRSTLPFVSYDFGKYVLCPYLGKPVEREKFEGRSVEDMGDYLRLTEGEQGQQGLRMKSKMVLQVRK